MSRIYSEVSKGSFAAREGQQLRQDLMENSSSQEKGDP